MVKAKQCQATTKSGTQCSRKAVAGSKFCAQHASSGSKSKSKVPVKKTTTPMKSSTKSSSHSGGAPILFYNKGKPYYEFTNFAPYGFKDSSGYQWPTSEHYFQAKKFLPGGNSGKHLHYIRTKISKTNPRAAFNYAHQHAADVRPNWTQVKDNVMRDALRYKFTQNPKLKTLLKSTGNSPLYEDSPYDTYWGTGGGGVHGTGKNMLGKLLMQLRKTL